MCGHKLMCSQLGCYIRAKLEIAENTLKPERKKPTNHQGVRECSPVTRVFKNGTHNLKVCASYDRVMKYVACCY